MVRLSPLELDVLNWFAENSNDPAIARQLSVVEAVQREFSGVGSFTELRVPSDLPRFASRTAPVSVSIESPELEYGACGILFFRDGLAKTLELVATGDTFPKHLKVYTLSHWGPKP